MDQLEVGNAAPTFSFEGADAEVVELTQFRGKIIVLFFIRAFS